jgi:tripartite-type tricarboxylate transporter receptor subunit TctC
MRLMKLVAFALCAALAVPWSASAQEFPAKPVHVVVPFLAGGSVDALARILSAKLGDYWAKPVVVENKPGAGGNIGSGAVAAADPDGHTLLFAPLGPLSYNGSLYSNMSFDPLTAFAHIALVGRSANFLIVGKDSNLKTVADLITAAKLAPGKLNYGSQGNGTTPHLTSALLAVRAGIEVVHVPYRGFPPLIADIVAGQVAFMFADSANTLPQLRNGQIRVLAVASAQRSPLLPEAPTVNEAGVPNFESTTWYGLAAPAKTPRPVVAKINADVVRALKDADTAGRIGQLGAEIVGSTPEEATRVLAFEAKRWGDIIRQIGAKAE